MKLIRPFDALRPVPELAREVAAPPYDVLSREEAFEMAKGNKHSFLRVNKPEIDVDPDIDVYDERVYRKGAENLRRFIDRGIMRRDDKPTFYIYRQIMGSHRQTGVVAAASIDAYEQDLIKKHEFTRPDKEDDRVNHIDTLSAQVGPVFLTYTARSDIDELVEQASREPAEYDFVADDDTRHIFWVIRDSALVAKLQRAFDTVDCLYVADGHHRSAAARRVRDKRRAANPDHTGEEPYNYFSAVIFPDNQVQVLDYNRIVADLNGLAVAEFLQAVEENFTVKKVTDRQAAKPVREHDFGMYLDGQWYVLGVRDHNCPGDDPVRSLDVAILQDNLLTPILGIDDPRVDTRIDFVGGIRGLHELEKRVDSGQWQLAFALYPTSIASLMKVSDAGEVMPPKSTWFEPKLRSGLFVHMLD